MPNWRRAHIPGGSFFFTVVTDGRARFLTEPPARSLLGSIVRRCQLKWPVTVNALVLLPDQLHAIWSWPPGDQEYPKRWGWIKKEFTKAWLGMVWSAHLATGRGRVFTVGYVWASIRKAGPAGWTQINWISTTLMTPSANNENGRETRPYGFSWIASGTCGRSRRDNGRLRFWGLACGLTASHPSAHSFGLFLRQTGHFSVKC
jgi:REP element-mobilizing transposase RayT